MSNGSFGIMKKNKLDQEIAHSAPCKAGDYVRTPQGEVYKITDVEFIFENDDPESYYFQCSGSVVYKNETLGPVERLIGFFKVIQRVERPYH